MSTHWHSGKPTMLIPCILIALLVLPGLAGAWSMWWKRDRSAKELTADDIKHVIVISIDTLRADYLGAYGHPYVKSPAIDSLAEEGVLFSRMFSAAPSTLASHTSLMTGTYPHTHGAPYNGTIVDEQNVMLPEILSEAGFTAVGFSGGYPLNDKTNFPQGYTTYRSRLGSAEAVTDTAISWIKDNDPKRMFMFLHYWDVHWPYQSPEPYENMYRDDDSPIQGTMQEQRALRSALKREKKTARETSEIFKRIYAGQVTLVDDQIARLLEGLRKHRILDDALVIFTADHGESMDEHTDYWAHGSTVYNAVTHIPLIIRLPGARNAGTTIGRTLSNIDVLPTVLDLLGLPAPERVEGIGFAPLFSGTEMDPRPPVFSQATRPRRNGFHDEIGWPNGKKCRGIWTDKWKMQECPRKGRAELYAFPDDWAEQDQLFRAGDPNVQKAARALKKQLKAWSAAAKPLNVVEDNSEETLNRLRELGYIE